MSLREHAADDILTRLARIKKAAAAQAVIELAAVEHPACYLCRHIYPGHTPTCLVVTMGNPRYQQPAPAGAASGARVIAPAGAPKQGDE